MRRCLEFDACPDFERETSCPPLREQMFDVHRVAARFDLLNYDWLNRSITL